MYRKILYVTAFEKFYQDVLSCALSLQKAGAEEKPSCFMPLTPLSSRSRTRSTS